LAALQVDDRETLCRFLERGRAGGLLESLGNRAVLEAAILPEEARAEEESARAAERAARTAYGAAVARGDRREIGERKDALDRAVEALDQVFGRTRRAAKAGILSIDIDPLTTIRGRLKPGEALVLYGLAAKASVALVVTLDGERAVTLAAEGKIVEAPRERLAELLIEPLALRPQVTRLLVSPDGPLARLPFALFCGEREVAYVPSGTAYGLLLKSAGERGTRVLALGDPDYGVPADPSRGSAYWSGGTPGALPATRAEAKVVGDTWLLGAEATKPRLLAAFREDRRWRAIHLACHGRVNPTSSLQSSLALSGDFLTCMDVLRNRLSCDLVVLSACDTAGGMSYAGEGIIGFTRAFLSAGAPRVLVSLWKVDDDATAALMERFYALWNPKDGAAGLPAATALRRAQAFVASQKAWSDPKYWAAWQLWGLPD
ncbi:MAG: CHAT domain-containing protein, partial [Planctomycetes bacterium]|nr:CHAT domain-containing protein [Planctomycetota bacterium]